MSFAFLTAVGEDSDGIGKKEKASKEEKSNGEKKDLKIKSPIQERTLELLTEAAVKGADDLTSAYNGLTAHQKNNLTSADKAYLKEVARNVNPS